MHASEKSHFSYLLLQSPLFSTSKREKSNLRHIAVVSICCAENVTMAVAGGRKKSYYYYVLCLLWADLLVMGIVVC